MSIESKKTWKCQTCRSKMPKTGNINTPVRPRDPEKNQDILETNVTMRRKINVTNNSSTSEDLSFLGDTQDTLANQTVPEINLQTLSQVISTKLEENNKYIISEIQNVIQMEIQKAVVNMRLEIKQDTTALFKQNELRKTDIEVLKIKMEELEKQNKTLQKEIKELETKITKETVSPSSQHQPENNRKKVVIYGFAEHLKETDSELHSRVMEMFDDILHLNTMGYIEDIHRVGRRNNRNRPLVVELISKRMVKYVLQNSYYFQGTGLSISEFLDAREQQERTRMREEMFSARKKGLHAIIRNTKLIIEGKIIDLSDLHISPYTTNNEKVKPKKNTNNEKDQGEMTSSKEDEKNNSFRN